MSNKSVFDLVSRFAKEERGVEVDYWGDAQDFFFAVGHQVFSPEEWRVEVANGDTRQGYWECVAAQLGIYEI